MFKDIHLILFANGKNESSQYVLLLYFYFGGQQSPKNLYNVLFVYSSSIRHIPRLLELSTARHGNITLVTIPAILYAESTCRKMRSRMLPDYIPRASRGKYSTGMAPEDSNSLR